MNRLIASGITLLVACGGNGTNTNPPEFISRVTLTFTPLGGTPIVASFDDPDGDGGDPPTIDPIDLVDGTDYTLTVDFLNALEDPPEDITLEVRDEADEHQVFLTGTGVVGPASDQASAPLVHTYLDMDINGLPVGLTNAISASSGTGMLTVTLRHLPPIDDAPTKTADVAAQVKAGGFAAIAGESDAQVTFLVTVR